MVLERPRPRRSRRWLWALAIIALVALGLWALAREGETTTTIDHLEDLRAATVEVSRSANVVAETLEGLSTTRRDEFQVVMVNATEAITNARELIQDSYEDPELGSVMMFLDVALDQWAAGLARLEEGVLNVVDFPSDTSGKEAILAGTQQLRLGDLSFAAAKDAMDSELTPEPIGSIPDIRFTPADGTVTDLAGVYETAASAENSPLGLLPSISVAQVVTIPAMVTDPAGIGVIPHTDEIDIAVVVANEGNSPSVITSLELRLTATVGTMDPIIEDVPVLESGENTTIEFNDLAVEPDTVYELAVLLTGLGQGTDLETDDNTVVIQFRVNPETLDTTLPTTTTSSSGEDL
ncbi:MAG: hypothetical protein GEU79_01915 [Acidimicrobiia bacterium]|nr:hypothetical protein [Acidimicrobiia bacterium]